MQASTSAIPVASVTRRAMAGAIMAALALVPLAAPPGGAPSASCVAFHAYEEGMTRLLHSSSPEERAEAIVALASIASPAYEEGRDALSSDSNEVVQIALLEAIGLMDDTSPRGVSCVERALTSQDRQLVEAAVNVENNRLRAPLEFSRIWSRSRAGYLWADFCRTNGWAHWQLISGVGRAGPWRDPAWRDLSDLTRMSLLFRAGTRESVPLGIALATSQKPPRWWGLVPAEAVDLPYIRKLLKDPHPEIRKYAARTLLAAGDPAYLASLHGLLREYRQGLGNVPDSALDDADVGNALTRLSESELQGLLQADPGRWFNPVYFELQKRGTPLDYLDLRGRRQPPLFDIGRVDSGFLRRCQLHALLREKVYADFPDYVTLALMDPRPAASMSDLSHELAAAWCFRAQIPAKVAQACQTLVEQWLSKSPNEGGPPAANPNGAGSGRLIVTLLASAQEREAAWRKFRNSQDPLHETAALQTILWGCDARGNALRQQLSTLVAHPWFLKYAGYQVAEPIKPQNRRGYPGAACRTANGNMWLPDSLPSTTVASTSLRNHLAEALLSSGVGDEKAYARALLACRGINLDEDAPAVSARWLADPRQAVRQQALVLLWPDLSTVGLAFPVEVPADEAAAWVKANRERLALPPVPTRRSPGMSEEDVAWLKRILEAGKSDYFNRLIGDLVNPPKGSGMVGCRIAGYSPPTPSVSPPSKLLLTSAGVEFIPELRQTLASPLPAVRQAAAYALWKMLRLPEAMAVFERDAHDPDSRVSAPALMAIEMFRIQRDAALFPPLLKDKNVNLRQAGLLGVRAFNLRETLPELTGLVVGPNSTVRALAVDTLGWLHPPQARPLLSRLVEDGGPLADTAAAALIHYRAREDLDALMQELVAAKTPETAKLRFVCILSAITGRAGRQAVRPFLVQSLNQNLAPETIQDWERWWARHRQEPVETRTKGIIVDTVRLALQSGNGEACGARQRLSPLLRNVYCLGGRWPLTPQCRELVQEWWHRVHTESAWRILTGPDADYTASMDALWDIDPARTRRLLFTTFILWAQGHYSAPRSSSTESPYDRLVRYAGVDFGDPTQARCGTKAAMLRDWLSWARREGWAE